MTETEMAKIAEMLYRKMSGAEDRELAQRIQDARGNPRGPMPYKSAPTFVHNNYIGPDGKLIPEGVAIEMTETDKALAARFRAASNNPSGSEGLSGWHRAGEK